jgi:hypothetical protein
MARPKKKGDFKDIITKKLKGNDVKEVASSISKKVEKQIKSKKVSKSSVKKVEVPKKTEIEVEESFSDLQIISKSFPPSSIFHEVYHNIPVERRITKHTDIGSRVIVAKYPVFYKIYFMEYIDVGKPHFPLGGIKVYNVTFEQTQYFYYDSVALHPTKKDKYRVKNIDE